MFCIFIFLHELIPKACVCATRACLQSHCKNVDGRDRVNLVKAPTATGVCDPTRAALQRCSRDLNPHPLGRLQRRRRHTNEPAGLYVLNREGMKKKKGEMVWLQGCSLYSSAATSFIICSISIRLPYIPACSHIGALWEFSCATTAMVGIPPPHTPLLPPQTFIIIVTLGARSGPSGP